MYYRGRRQKTKGTERSQKREDSIRFDLRDEKIGGRIRESGGVVLTTGLTGHGVPGPPSTMTLSVGESSGRSLP